MATREVPPRDSQQGTGGICKGLVCWWLVVCRAGFRHCTRSLSCATNSVQAAQEGTGESKTVLDYSIHDATARSRGTRHCADRGHFRATA